MSIHFRKLKNNQDDRAVRTVIMSGSDHINVYEPSLADISAILDAQEGWVSVEEGVQVSEQDVLRKLIPMLTDIRGIDELSDEEITDVLDNPTLALLNVKNEIEGIIKEVYKYIVLISRRQLQDADFEMESMLINKESMNRTIALAHKYGDDKDLPEKVQKAADNLKKAYEAENNDELKEVLSEHDSLLKEIEAYGLDIDLESGIEEAEAEAEKDKVMAEAIEKSENALKAVEKELDLGESLDKNQVKKDEETGDIFTTDGERNITQMIEERKKAFANPKNSIVE